MHKTFIRTAAIMTICLAFAGCQEKAKKGDRYMADRSALKTSPSETLFAPTAKEVDLVEKMAGFRAAYRQSVVDLVEYYKKAGNDTNRLWAISELESLDSTQQYEYITLGVIAGPDLRATASIPQANVLYDDAMQLYRKAKWTVIFTHGGKLQQSLRKFDEIIRKYPTSNKIDDAAYRAAKVYDHFKDYKHAVVYYQRAFQWNSETRHPVRYRAAYILDQILHQRDEALPIYQLCLEKERMDEDRTDFVKLRIKKLTTSKEQKGLDIK